MWRVTQLETTCLGEESENKFNIMVQKDCGHKEDCTSSLTLFRSCRCLAERLLCMSETRLRYTSSVARSLWEPKTDVFLKVYSGVWLCFSRSMFKGGSELLTKVDCQPNMPGAGR